MSWQEVTRVSLREEFVRLARQEGSNRRELCRRFKISPQTGYKWLRRYEAQGVQGLEDRSRRPRQSPSRTRAAIEQQVIELRAQSRNCWGGRKLSRQLLNRDGLELPPSTITSILRRAGLINPALAAAARPYQRFERSGPNELWQMDFKGHFALLNGKRCHPLTVLDDHSRFDLVLSACDNERADTVQAALTTTFRRYGLPVAMLMDNGAPWAAGRAHSWSSLSLWLVRLGIQVSHGRPYHPQTQGKDERFHRTLQFELLRHFNFSNLDHCQWEFDRFRQRYNCERPHDALALDTPASRYQVSALAFPETLPPIEYPPGLEVRKVQSNGWFSYRGREFRVTEALRGLPIGLRRVAEADSQREVLFCHQVIARIDFNHADIKR